MSLDLDGVTAILSAKAGHHVDGKAEGRGAALHKVGGKMFAILGVAKKTGPFVILKCDPHLAEVLRETYAGVGQRSHLDPRFWICVDLGSDVPDDELRRLIDGSYDLVVATLTKKAQAQLKAG
jgi:predicted DNA-binding protein (MmcQ/YjbR family)